MLSAAVFVGLLALGPGLGLAPGEEPVAPVEGPTPIEVPEEGGGATPLPILTGLVAAAAALASRRPGVAVGLRPPEDTLVVFVPGHGHGPGEEAYRDFIELTGLDPAAVRHFDYRWVTGGDDARRASTLAPTPHTALALNAYVSGVAAGEHPVWLVGFSKGGAAVAELVEYWDRGILETPGGVRGAMLLDPPMARGLLGKLQSVGRVVGPIPDDGGYDPVDCVFLGLGCRDHRAYLGAQSGVEVLVVRNPRAAVTSFGDLPPGLRVIDAPDDGPGPWGQVLRNPLRLFGRISEAHDSVLSDPDVARCLVQEMWEPESCTLGQPAIEVPEFSPLPVRASSWAGRAV